MNQRDHSPADYWAWVRDARDPAATDVIPAMTEDSFESAIAQRIPTEAMWQQMRDSEPVGGVRDRERLGAAVHP